MAEGDSDAPRKGVQAGIARRTFLGFRADVVSAVSMLVTAIVVARALGPADRGLYFLVFLASMLIAMIADVGMSTTSMVYGGNREIPSRQLHGVAVVASVLAALLAAALLLPLEGFWTEGVLNGLDTTLLAIVAASVLPMLYSQIVVALLTGMGHVPEVSAVRVAQSVLYPLLVIPAAALTGSPQWAAAAWLATTVAYAVALGAYAARFAGPPAIPTRATSRTVVSFGSRSYVGSLSYQGFLRVDVLFLSARYGPSVVGVYSLAATMAERIGVAGFAMYGATAEAVSQGGREAARLTSLTTRLMLAMLIPLGIVLGLLAAPGFSLVFGDDFADAALPFVILLPGTIALVCWHFMSLYIVSALRRPGTTTVIQGAALLVSLPLYWIAVREWEMTGAAIVSAGTYLALFAAGAWVFLRNSGLPLRELVPGRREARQIGEVTSRGDRALNTAQPEGGRLVRPPGRRLEGGDGRDQPLSLLAPHGVHGQIDPPAGVLEEQSVEEVLLVEEPAGDQTVPGILVREEDVVDLHPHAGGELRQHLEQEAVHLAAELDHVGGVDEQDVAGVQLPEPFDRQVPGVGPLEAPDAAQGRRHLDPRLGVDRQDLHRRALVDVPGAGRGRDPRGEARAQLQHTLRLRVADHRVQELSVAALVQPVPDLNGRHLRDEAAETGLDEVHRPVAVDLEIRAPGPDRVGLGRDLGDHAVHVRHRHVLPQPLPGTPGQGECSAREALAQGAGRSGHGGHLR